MDEPTIESIKRNLSAVAEIIRETEKELDKDGSRFNIFSILNLSASEVRLHSNFIAELLDPGGTHSFRTEFLELFIKQLKRKIYIKSITLDSFVVSAARVEVEKWIGFINDDYTYGGKIDIVISDKSDHRIIIENKIKACDQPKQLFRYYNYDPKALLLYLAMNNGVPDDVSTAGKILDNKDFYCLSYEEFILPWLKECYEIARGKPKVSETISQYMNIIKDYTSHSPYHIMKENIIKLISSDKEFYNSIEEINSAYQALIQSINNDFWNKLQNMIPNDQKLLTLTDKTDIFYRIDEDSAGFFFGFYLIKDNMRVNCSMPEYQYLVTALKDLRSEVFNNQNYICWIFPGSIPRWFSHLGKEKIFDLQERSKMDSLIDQILNEFNQVKKEVIQRIENTKNV